MASTYLEVVMVASKGVCVCVCVMEGGGDSTQNVWLSLTNLSRARAHVFFLLERDIGYTIMVWVVHML